MPRQQIPVAIGELSTRKEAPKKKVRRGRRAMNDIAAESTDHDSLRKERTRLAQRAYRNRKESEVDNLKGQVNSLQDALRKSIRVFTRFQEAAIQSDDLPPKVALELSRTALEIASISLEAFKTGDLEEEEVQTNEDDESLVSSHENSLVSSEHVAQPSEYRTPNDLHSPEIERQQLDLPPILDRSTQTLTTIPAQVSSPIFPWTASQHNLAFTHRLRLACIERAVQILSDPFITFASVHPMFSLYLRDLPVAEMRSLTQQSLFQDSYLVVSGPPKFTSVNHPNLFRTIEGNGDVLVARENKHEVKSLAFGTTRTLVQTWLPGFEGEWMEPLDVREYLESESLIGPNEELIERLDDRVLNLYSLIERLALRAVCIGGPGFKKHDVLQALDQSIMYV